MTQKNEMSKSALEMEELENVNGGLNKPQRILFENGMPIGKKRK